MTTLTFWLVKLGAYDVYSFLFSGPRSVLFTVTFVDYFSDELDRQSPSKIMELRKG